MTTNYVSMYSTGDYARCQRHGTHTYKWVGGLKRGAGGHFTTERPIAERTSSRASQHFRERVRNPPTVDGC